MESNWLDLVRNSFDSIWEFAIPLIWKGKKYSRNSIRINWRFVRFHSTPTIGLSQIFEMLDSFNSIRKFMIRLIRKVKDNSKNSIKINSKFVQFDSTPTIGEEPNFQKLKFIRNSFDSKICNSIDSKGEKNSMKINSIQFNSTPITVLEM